MPNVIIDKKGQSDDDDDDDAAGMEDKNNNESNDLLGRGDEGDGQLMQPQPPALQNEDVSAEGEGNEDHGVFVLSVQCF